MNAIHQFIRLGRDDGGRVDDLIASMPMLGETGEGERLVVLESDEEGLLGRAGLLPLIKAIRNDQASTFFERRPKCRLDGDRIGPGID
jgi:hypothetical protein